MAVTIPPDMAGGGEHGPPQNVDAEVAVLGSVLFAPNALATLEIEVKLRPEDFYSGRNRIVYAAMRRLQDKADPSPVDAVTLLAELERASELEAAGGEAYVRSLGSAVPAAGHFKHYAQIVKDLSQRRKLMIAAQEIQEQVFSFQGGTPDLLEQSESKLFKIGHDDAGGALRSIADVLHVEIDKLEKVSRAGVSMTGTPTGYKDLDELTGGFQPGNLIVLAARPSMGKSALVTNMAENASVDSNKSVALFSLEMSETELAQRFVASQAKLNGDDLRKGKISQDRWPRVLKATEKLAAAPLYVDDSS
nr:replicative DNA helicase [Thermoleophilaceae bacterium]